ncbi:HNH endonuclease [Pseudochrobactrum asaccharolyticum]|uniref:HNH endonuclease n=1 Tax=Pseudochrobactrum asaccharolyticum TaxID=354351 RepID=A0A366DQ87_9HYPH|nr:HNH endonuclease signature motif containing protein [Pseudochrobactrum asaccharolyticum]RBO92256.1 HNH endonuclease [Pseudochrobactrum asaccharolyticum]
MSKRMEFSRKIKAQIITRANGKCKKCSVMLKTGEGEVDHILPCALGGETTVPNGRLLCRVCQVKKTADDIRRVRKFDRQRDKASGAVQAKSALAGRKQPKPAPTKTLPPRAMFVPASHEALAQGGGELVIYRVRQQILHRWAWPERRHYLAYRANT